MPVSGKPDLVMERNYDTLIVGSVMNPHWGYHTEDFWNLQNLGAFSELFLVIARKLHPYREVLQKFMLGCELRICCNGIQGRV